MVKTFRQFDGLASRKPEEVVRSQLLHPTDTSLVDKKVLEADCPLSCDACGSEDTDATPQTLATKTRQHFHTTKTLTASGMDAMKAQDTQSNSTTSTSHYAAVHSRAEEERERGFGDNSRVLLQKEVENKITPSTM